MASVGRMVAGGALVAVMLAGTIGEASAARASKIYRGGRHVGYHQRHYGNPAVGAAVAGTALGIIGLAAGAAAANSYEEPGYGYGYGYSPGPGYYQQPYGYDGY